MRPRAFLLALLFLAAALAVGPHSDAPPSDGPVPSRPHLIPPSPHTTGWPLHTAQGEAILPEVAQTTGTARIIVLLVEFSDVLHNPSRTPAAIDASLNSVASGAKSLRAYYEEVSFGALTVNSTVVTVWLQSSRSMSYYGADSSSGIDDQNGDIYVLAAEAVKLFDASVDFSQYDADGNGDVDHLIVVHAGEGQETNPSSTDLIWSHRWVVPDDPFLPGSQPLLADNTQIFQYMMVSEVSPIGVAAHEFGHDLGLPDLYDTDGSSDGAGLWDIMAGGTWNGNPAGSSPAHFSAWVLLRVGWVAATDVTTSLVNEAIPAVASTGRVYRLAVPGSGGSEYFLVENRQPIGFDDALPGSGLLIWHVDDTRGSNHVDEHRWVDLEEADEAIAPDRPRDSDDPWENTGAGWGPETLPDSRSYAGAETGWRVRDISASAATMTATIAREVQKDLAVSAIRLPFTASVTGRVDIAIDVRNDGTQSGDVDLRLTVYRGAFNPSSIIAQQSFTRAGLPAGAPTNFTSNFTPTTTGRHIVHSVLLAAADEIPSNDERVAHVLVNDFQFRDDIESGAGGWTTNDDGSLSPSAHRWRIVADSETNGASHSRTHAWRLGYVPTLLPDPFPPEWHHLTSGPIGVNPGSVFLIFYGRYDLSGRTVPIFPIGANETDEAYVEVNYNGGPTWVKMARYTGRDLTWRGASFNLTSNITGATTLRVRFNVSANVMGNAGGWWIDDVMIAERGLNHAVLLIGSAGPHEGPAGGTIRFTFKVANVGDLDADFRLDATPPGGWDARVGGENGPSLRGYIVHLAPDSDLAVRAFVRVPAGAPAGDHSIVVTSTAVGDPNVVATFAVEARVTGIPMEWVLYGGLAAAAVVILLVAIVAARRRRRRPPA